MIVHKLFMLWLLCDNPPYYCHWGEENVGGDMIPFLPYVFEAT